MGAGVRPEPLTPDEEEFQRWKEQQGLEEKPKLSTQDKIIGTLASVRRGAMFGLDDEAHAVMRYPGEKLKALVTGEKAKTFDELREESEGPRKRLEQSSKGLGLGLELAGAFATPGGAGKKAGEVVAKTAGFAARAARAARGVGRVAAESAVTGAGSAEGGAVQRIKGAAKGAAGGAAAGGLFKGAGKIGSYGADMIPGMRRAGSKALLSSDERGAQKIVERMGDGGVTLDAAEAAAKATTKPKTLMEVGGENVAGLTRGARTFGKNKQQINERLHGRMEGAEERVLADVLETSGLPRESHSLAKDAFIRQREEAASPVYGKLREAYGPVKIAELDELLDRPSMQSAIKETEAILREQARRVPGEAFQPLLVKVKVDTGKGVQEITQLRPLSFDEADLLKRSLDDVSDVAKVPNPIEAGGVGKTRRSKMTDTRAEVVKILDNTFAGDEAAGIPSYAAARDAFAGPQQMLKAYEEGAALFKTAPDEIAATLEKMSASEQSAFRKAAAEALRERIEAVSAGRDIDRSIAGKTLDKKRLRLIFPDDASYEAFKAKLGEEAQMHRSRQFVQGNSQTADKLAELADLADIPLLDAAGSAMTGNLPGALMGAFRYGAKAGRGLEMGARASTIGDLTTRGATNQAELLETIQKLRELTQSAAEKTATGRKARGAASRVVGGRAGGA